MKKDKGKIKRSNKEGKLKKICYGEKGILRCCFVVKVNIFLFFDRGSKDWREDI